MHSRPTFSLYVFFAHFSLYMLIITIFDAPWLVFYTIWLDQTTWPGLATFIAVESIFHHSLAQQSNTINILFTVTVTLVCSQPVNHLLFIFCNSAANCLRYSDVSTCQFNVLCTLYKLVYLLILVCGVSDGFRWCCCWLCSGGLPTSFTCDIGVFCF